MFEGFIAGNVGQDGVLGQAGESPVLNFNVATDTYDSKTKEKGTEWVRCALFGKRAQALAPFIKKGSSVAVTGEVSLRKYEHNGEHRSELNIKATNVKLLGGRRDDAPNAAPIKNDEIPFG